MDIDENNNSTDLVPNPSIIVESPPLLYLVHYSPTTFEETILPIDEFVPSSYPNEILWIHIEGTPALHQLEKLQNFFCIHPLVVEDMVNGKQRAKFDDYQDVLFIVMRQLEMSGKHIYDMQVNVLIGENWVISTSAFGTNFEDIRARLRRGNPRIRSMGSDYLGYAIIDVIVDHTFALLQTFDDRLALLEEEVELNPKTQTLVKLQRTRRAIAMLRQSIWPLREVINHFRHLDSPLIQRSTIVYVNDVYDHTIQMIETVDTFRDISSGLLDVYVSQMSYRMNEIMEVLTIVATIFVPLTFLSSVYGMNFKYMPELDSEWGYAIFWVIVLLITLGMIIYFKRKRWF